jgi:hypothetical protein
MDIYIYIYIYCQYRCSVCYEISKMVLEKVVTRSKTGETDTGSCLLADFSIGGFKLSNTATVES